MKKVICWYIRNKDGSWNFNHISDGWHADIYPRTKNKIQRENWRRHKWKQAYAYMTNDGLVSENAFRIAASVALEEHEDYYIPSDKQTHAIEPRCPYSTVPEDK